MSSKNLKTRERILSTALKLLEAGRGEGVRMSDIAKKAGISRQAVYLHFPSRAELLIAVTRYLDEVKDVDGRLARSRTAATGIERLNAFIDAWGDYIPEIYGVARALMAMQETDKEAEKAWADRLRAVHQGCAAAVEALALDGSLTPEHSVEEATDLLWTLLSVRNWEQLTRDCGWPQEKYIAKMQILARQTLVK
ncbi:TetR/AcrR family transcriptional regulator [Emcibacter sp.]|uniref:TetR/AcrR family transcriptional regulator n=1 Tax=Emcibacter sp. TaxID=1979954 RepID=UPI002AA7DEAB|nr:TetR/AcrR family transcriptional regulator [Emcibacter sp.]